MWEGAFSMLVVTAGCGCGEIDLVIVGRRTLVVQSALNCKRSSYPSLSLGKRQTTIASEEGEETWAGTAARRSALCHPRWPHFRRIVIQK